jgi:hypothetical protein
MRPGQQRLVSTLSLGLAAVMLTGCAQDSSVRQNITPPERAAAAQALQAPAAQTRDVRACAGIQALIGHITVSTARWSPNLHPFDKVISGKIHALSVDLDKEAAVAQTVPIQMVVHSNALAFAAVADAMAGKDLKAVYKSVAASKVTYRQLKKACSLE